MFAAGSEREAAAALLAPILAHPHFAWQSGWRRAIVPRAVRQSAAATSSGSMVAHTGQAPPCFDLTKLDFSSASLYFHFTWPLMGQVDAIST